MTKRFFLLLAFLANAFLIGLQAVNAQTITPPTCDVPPCVYVDRTRTDGNEDGSEIHPYNAENEGRALAQSQSHGAYLIVQDPNGSWRKEFIPRAEAGIYGTPFPDMVLYILLSILALLLILAGWWLMRRSRQLKS
jgi:hypothetical protein